MILETFISLIYNAALLLSLAVVYDLLAYEESRINVFTKIYTGLIIGVIALAIMLNPWTMQEGIVFDSRTILFSLGAMFFGPLPALISTLPGIFYRILMGGAGVYTGVSTILFAVFWGLLWRHLHIKSKKRYSGKEFYALGFLNHITMLLLMLLMPADVRWHVIRVISLPVIVLFPLATVVLGMILVRRLERQKEKRALKISEKKYRQLSETTKDMIVLHDVSGKIHYANRMALDFFGMESLETADISIYQYIQPSDIERAKSYAKEILEGYQGLRIYSLQAMDFQGRHRLAEVSSSAMEDDRGKFLLAAIRDVTDRIRTQEQKDNYANRLEILRELDSIVLETQSFEKVCNAAVVRLQKLIPFEILTAIETKADKLHIVAMHKPEERYRYISQNSTYPCDEGFCEDLLRKRNFVISDTSTIKDEPGKPINAALINDGIRSFMYSGMIIQDELVGYLWFGSVKQNGFTLEHIEIAREFANQLAIVLHHLNLIQKIKDHASQMEKQVLDRTRQLSEVNQELEAFSYSVAHDLRAPLKIISGFSEVLRDDFGPSLKQDAVDILKTIELTAKRMDGLIRDLLELSRMNREELHKTEVYTATVVSDLISAIVPKDSFDLEISELPPCFGDETLITQIWQNLIDNAVKFTLPAVKRQIVIGSEVKTDEIIYYIRDTGIGFDPDQARAIFAPFQRLHGKDKYEGTGIGLALVKKAVQRHGGKIWAESEPDKGSTFSFSLPIKKED